MITITVSGPGGCMEMHRILIQEALEKAGIQVYVTHGFAHRDFSDEAVRKHWEYLKEHKVKPFRVDLIIEDQPWGG